MVIEAYCSYEVAKLLKEKGFDGDGGDCECHMFYSSYSKMIMPITEIGLVSDFDEVYYAPTHQMAMAYLRKEKGLFIAINCDDLDYNWQVLDVLQRDENADPTVKSESYGGYRYFEDAVEAALLYVLQNLI